MKITNVIKQGPSTAAISEAIKLVGQTKLAALIGVASSTPAMWRTRGVVPAEYCAAIECATGRQVTRQQLRPDDWRCIWPELAVIADAGCIADESAAAQKTEGVSA